jgi:hypothetical protein
MNIVKSSSQFFSGDLFQLVSAVIGTEIRTLQNLVFRPHRFPSQLTPHGLDRDEGQRRTYGCIGEHGIQKDSPGGGESSLSSGWSGGALRRMAWNSKAPSAAGT